MVGYPIIDGDCLSEGEASEIIRMFTIFLLSIFLIVPDKRFEKMVFCKILCLRKNKVLLILYSSQS